MAGAEKFGKGNRHELAGQAYILQNQVTHVRFLPLPSRHSFIYPTISFLVSLNALETKALDLCNGWIFGYGGKWGRITGLRASGYLHDNPADVRPIKSKLIDILSQHGFMGQELDDAWLMTMPSFLGVEGINPLSIYFCYRRGISSLWLVVLEVHNTFGERHVYVLDTRKCENVHSGFDYQWTFSRQFHVSPFNDRSGHYVCHLTPPPHPPSRKDPSYPVPRPIVKLTLLTAPPHAEKKIVAVLRATHSVPLSSTALISTLARAPFGLLLSFPRIFYQAYLLHYFKRLDLYQRPEPCAPDPTIEAQLPPVINPVEVSTSQIVYGGIGWQKKGFIENWCQHRVYEHLRERCADIKISVVFISANPIEGRTVISSPNYERTLTIHYRTPKIFTILFMMPSPLHTLSYGIQAEKVFSVSSDQLFIEAFSAPLTTSSGSSFIIRCARRIREALLPASLDIPIPPQHALDTPMGLVSITMLFLLFLAAILEKKVFNALGARFVPGDEPWTGWERLQARKNVSRDSIGSVWRESPLRVVERT